MNFTLRDRVAVPGLSALVKNTLHEDPTSGHLFVFINRKHTQMKVLYFDRSVYCVWSKRLEQVRFQYRSDGAYKVALDWTQLKLILEGSYFLLSFVLSPLFGIIIGIC